MSSVEELVVSLTKDKIFKYKVTSADGRTASGRTRQAAIDQWHLLYDEKMSYGYDLSKINDKFSPKIF